MSTDRYKNGWWELHLKQAKGQELSDSEQQIYDAEIARLDCTEPCPDRFETLKNLRAEVAALAKENDELRSSADELQAQIRTIEQSLNKETRQLLGVEE